MTTSTSVSNSLLDAMDIISESREKKLNFDKTIIGNVLSCVDAEIGKYKIKFQDAYYYATVSNEEDTYDKGDSVYVLIPNNDLQREKKIIGLVENLGKGYIASSGIETQFEAAGANVITHSSSFSYPLKTENKEDIEEILYDVNNPENNKLNIDADIFAEFARTATKLQISARFKTNAPIIYERGNFGLKFDLEFYADTEFRETTTKTYTLDTNSMIGTFYELADYLKQNAILDFNGAFFKRILKITAFVKDFKYTDKGAEANRIFIDDISILAMVDASSNDWNTYYLKLETPYGTTFNSSVKTLSLVANTTFKNRKVEDDKLEYYWFIRNSAISSNDTKYCEHGGRGWYCLNTHDDEKKKWVPASNIFTINAADMLGASAEYKCVAVKDNIATAFKEITIYNSEAKYYIEMKSSINGDTFYLDQGATNITCTVKGSKEGYALSPDNFNFYWSRLNSQEKAVDFIAANGGVPSIDPTIIVGDQQKKTTLEVVNILKNLKTHFESCFASETVGNKIENKGKGDRFTVGNYTANVPGLDANIIKVLQLAASETKNEDVYNKTKSLLTGTQISYVDKNIFYNLKGSIITEKNTFVCTVYEKDTTDETKERYVGVGKIDIRNISSPQSVDYYLTLKNHNQVFKYNQQGKSPTHRTNTSPQNILPLSFEFFDKNHTKIDLSKSPSALVKWWVPKENTLIEYIPPEGTSLSEIPLDTNEEYYLINNHKLTFAIADTYDPMKIENTIFLEVSYNNFYSKQPINLSILKEGQNGTNGTDYYCRITPNTLSTEYPTIYCWEDGSEWIVKSNFVGSLEEDVNNVNMIESSIGETDENGNVQQVLNAIPWFKCELWNSGSLLTPTSIHWKILGNEGEILTNSPFELISNESSSELYLTVNKSKLDNILNTETEQDDNGNFKIPAPFLTIQVEVLHEQKHYYATQPIALVYCGKAQPIRRPRFLKSSGFNEAIYASDGTNPQYASAPFKLEMVNWGNVITDDTSLQDSDTVVWKSYGETNLVLEGEEKNEKVCKLPSTFDGFKINNGIYCTINNDIKFFFPIHMYLNRYGLSHLNSWDGNSIKISEEEGYILSPQIGAGRKETDNTFTGMLMGEVKGGQGEDKVGLLGYGDGVQTMFLDAETGSAYFGKSGEISIEPNGKDTKVKLGVWNLDNEAIWKNEQDQQRLFGGEKGYFELTENETYENLYFGSKGLSLDNKFVFFNEEVNDYEAGTLKIGPWFVENTAFWKGSNQVGKANGIYMGDEGFSLGEKFIFKTSDNTLRVDGKIHCRDESQIGGFIVHDEGFFMNAGKTKISFGLNVFSGMEGYGGLEVFSEDDINNQPYTVSLGTSSDSFQGVTISTSTSALMHDYNSLLYYHDNDGLELISTIYFTKNSIEFEGAGCYCQLGYSSTNDIPYFRSTEPGMTYLGTSSFPWYKVYSEEGVSTASDRNKKQNITSLHSKYIDLFYKLKHVSYQYKTNPEITRIGFIAQDIEKALKETNLDLKDFGSLIIDKEENEKTGLEEINYNLHYEDFNALTVAVLQKALDKIDKLEVKVYALQNELDQLK